jgi:glycosyltransferase involved in cell wall biosynthesis
LLLVAFHFPPENASGATRPGHFAKYLPYFGYAPRVVSRSIEPSVLEGTESVRRVPDELTASEAVVRMSRAAEWVQRWFLPYNEQLPWAPFGASAVTACLQSPGVRLVLSTSPPIVTHLAVLRAKLSDPTLRWVVDLQDPLWGNPFRTRRMASYYDRTLERLIFHHADAVIANTESVGELWRRRYPRWRGKIHVITNGFDPDDEIPSRPPIVRKRRIVAHVGAIYGGRRPTAFLAAALRLIERGALAADEVGVRLVGPLDAQCANTGVPPFSRLVEKGCLEYTGTMVPASEAREAMLDANYLLLLDVNERGDGLQVPAKLYEYMRTGRPILALTPTNSPTQTILENGGVWHRCVPADAPPEKIEACVEEFLSKAPLETAANSWFYETFSARTKTMQLVGILQDLERRPADS